MTIEHSAPDMVCDVCYRRVDTVHDGDTFVALERGWGVNNVRYPIATAMPDERRAAGLAAQDYEHMCPPCLAERGWTVTGDLDDPEWPFIGCYDYNAPMVTA